jgi:hypothetical protein
MVITFHNDDAGYLEWIQDNPLGYLINCQVNPSSRYVVLHRASCHTISGRPTRGREWTAQYKKVCAKVSRELEEWSLAVVNVPPQRCGTCNP